MCCCLFVVFENDINPKQKQIGSGNLIVTLKLICIVDMRAWAISGALSEEWTPYQKKPRLDRREKSPSEESTPYQMEWKET